MTLSLTAIHGSYTHFFVSKVGAYLITEKPIAIAYPSGEYVGISEQFGNSLYNMIIYFFMYVLLVSFSDPHKNARTG